MAHRCELNCNSLLEHSTHTNNDLSLVLFPSRTIPLESVQLIFKSRHVPNLCDGSTSFCKETFSQSSPRVPLDFLPLCKYLGFSWLFLLFMESKSTNPKGSQFRSFSAGNFSTWPQHAAVPVLGLLRILQNSKRSISWHGREGRLTHYSGNATNLAPSEHVTQIFPSSGASHPRIQASCLPLSHWTADLGKKT